MRICAYCGGQFEWERKPGQRGRTKIFCSARCSRRSRYVPRPSERDPEVSSAAASIAASARWAKASAGERADAARRAALARYTPEQSAAHAAKLADLEARRHMPCPYCGDPVGRAGRVKCPKSECNLRHNAARMRAFTSQRRAAKRGVGSERFDPREVFDRDKWVCGICELSVDPRLAYPDPGSASLDHIVPLALGGPHSRANTQCAHLYCNSVKGARIAI